MKSRDLLKILSQLTKPWYAPEGSEIERIEIEQPDIHFKDGKLHEISLNLYRHFDHPTRAARRLTYELNDKGQWRITHSWSKKDATIITKFFKEHVNPIVEQLDEESRYTKREEKEL
jgi:hypothetical protein